MSQQKHRYTISEQVLTFDKEKGENQGLDQMYHT